MFKPTVFKGLLLGLAIFTNSATAQNMPLCQTANGYSLDQAEQAILRADNIITQVNDCAQVNLMMCEDAERLYKQAEEHLHQVLFDARGEACTYCDTTRIGSLSRILSERETYIRQNLQYPVELAWMWRVYQNWINAPYCQNVGAPPVAPPPLPPAARSCAPYDTWQGSYLPDADAVEYVNIDYASCQQACDASDWCKSFDFNDQVGACNLHAVSRFQVALKSAFNDQIYHIGCKGRY